MLSIIIPTYNAKNNIENLIANLKKQRLTEKIEIIIIDSSSSDGTAEFCKVQNSIKFIQIKKSDFNHGHTRNLAVEASSGDILVFMTQDAIPLNDSFLYEITKPIREKIATAAYGRQVAGSSATTLEKLTRDFNYPERDVVKSKSDIKNLGIKTFFFTNVCSAIEKNVFKKLNGFPDDAILNEDMLFAYKLIMSGQKIMYASKARVIHFHNYTCMQQLRRNFDIGASLKINQSLLQYASAETEGKRFVLLILKKLYLQKKFADIFYFICQSGFKFLGYKMGLHYNIIPTSLKKILSMNPSYWTKRKV